MSWFRRKVTGSVRGSPAELPGRYAVQRDELINLRMENVDLHQRIIELQMELALGTGVSPLEAMCQGMKEVE